MDSLLALLSHYGIWVLLMLTIVAAFGLPAPASLGLIAAGACSRTGLLDPRLVLAAGLAGTVIGDHLAYLAGRGAAEKVRSWRVGRHIERARPALERWGVLQVFLSRFVFPTVLTPGTNYVAGLTRYPLNRFSPAVVAGEAVYVAGYTALGWAFSVQIAQINAVAATASALTFVMLLALYFMLMTFRSLRS